MKVDIIVHNHKCPFKQEHEHCQHKKKAFCVTTLNFFSFASATRVDSMLKINGGG